MSKELQDRVAVVTGAGRGIGRAVALDLASRGACVVVNDLGVAPDGAGADSAPASAVAQEIVGAGGRAVADTSDVATATGGQTLIGTALRTFGRVDVLVLAAGIFRHNLIAEMPVEDWDAVIQVHLGGHLSCVRAALPHLRAQGSGRILTFASGVATHGQGAAANYGAAKGAIIGLTRSLAQELAEDGITVNVIAPAAESRVTVEVGRKVNAMRAEAGLLEKSVPFVLPPAELITPAIAYLCSDHGAGTSGEILHLMGGTISRGRREEAYRTVTAPHGWSVAALQQVLPTVLLSDARGPV